MSDVMSFIENLEGIKQVYWVACGGSVIDLYPAHCLLQAEAKDIESAIYTAAEFNTFTPAALGDASLVVACSHSGGTKEVFEAVTLAEARGAKVLCMTNKAGSLIESGSWPTWIYEWEDDTPQESRPAGFSLLLATRLIAGANAEKVQLLTSALAQLDSILPVAKAKVAEKLGAPFVEFCQKHPFFYILGSGPTFCQTYGFAICSMMEMQWQHCSYINSAEYFHGPFEVTEPGVAYFLQKSGGAARSIDERAEVFLKSHTDDLIVLDSEEFGMDAVPAEFRSYLDPIFFYEMNVTLREERGKVFDHHPDTRRYMGKVAY